MLGPGLEGEYPTVKQQMVDYRCSVQTSLILDAVNIIFYHEVSPSFILLSSSNNSTPRQIVEEPNQRAVDGRTIFLAGWTWLDIYTEYDVLYELVRQKISNSHNFCCSLKSLRAVF